MRAAVCKGVQPLNIEMGSKGYKRSDSLVGMVVFSNPV